jgi:UDP-2,3-diacylglucosamine pyrophosphatase LpxH
MLAKIGSRLYEFLLRANRWVNYFRRKMGFSYWSLAAFLKHKVKNAVQYISNFEEAVAHEASKQGVDGVVCGHIHRAEITRIHDIDYYNCGDWVESCTALVEHPDGQMEIIPWAEVFNQHVLIAKAA